MNNTATVATRSAALIRDIGAKNQETSIRVETQALEATGTFC